MTENPPPAGQVTKGPKKDHFLKDLLAQYPQYFEAVLKNPDTLGVQIIYTQINRDKNNKPSLVDYYYNVNPEKYFYPASTVKMPVALLALERLNELKKADVTRKSTMITEAEGHGQTVVYNDPTSADGCPTVEQYIKKIFLVSDNDAYNRLYEFLGQEYINDRLHQKGYKEVQLLHRLQLPLGFEDNRYTNPVSFFDTSGNLLYRQPAQYNKKIYEARNTRMGKGYVSGDKIINEPFDFSQRNRISLLSLHRILQSVIFPETVPENQRFHITDEDYRFVWKYMSQFPGESNYPSYPDLKDWDAYCKFVFYGSEKGRLPKHMRIFNKVGDAYGFLLDIAYVADFEKKIEFFVSTVIYCNSDGIFNDDKYDYDEVGFPFMKHLGQVLYEYEAQRPKKYLPDFSSYQFIYDK